MEQAKKIICREWESFTASQYGLNNDTVDRLQIHATRLERRLRQPILTRTVSGFVAAQVVGILVIPGLTVEILPKIENENSKTRETLVRMLKVAYGLRITDSEIAFLSNQHFDLLEILIRIFSQRLLVAVRRGLPRRYTHHEEDLRLLRGKLNVTRQITKLAVRADLVACRFDELSPDTPLNRVLKAAVVRLADLSHSESNIRLLNELQIHFESVSTASAPLDEPVRLDRTNTNYHELYGWAQLFLRGDYQSTSGGRRKGFSLLFAMNDLFEMFIGNSLKRLFADISGSNVSLQERKHSVLLDESDKPIFKLIPDAVVKLQDRSNIVLDTKWKRLDTEDTNRLGVDQDDIYQMMAYAHAYTPSRLILLYPWHEAMSSEKGIVRRWRISGSKIPLDIATIDVGCSNGFNFNSRIQCALNEITRT